MFPERKSPDMSKVIYTCAEKQHNKVWSADTDGLQVTIEWGRIGDDPQQQIKTFGSDFELQTFLNKKIQEKLKKGYKLSSDKELDKQVDIAAKLGRKNKITKMEFVSRKGTFSFPILTAYDPDRWVYLEVMDSWSKEVNRFVISKTESYRMIDVSFEDRMIECGSLGSDGTWGRTLRDVLQLLMAQISVIVTRKLGALGVRRLNLGGNDIPSSDVVQEVFTEMQVSAVSEQVFSKLAGLGTRKLAL